MPSGQDFLNQLADIRQRQGKEPIDGTRIEGFDQGQPPPPPDFVARRLDEAEPRPDFPDEDPDYDVVDELPPLVRIARDLPKPNPFDPGLSELLVIENAATYRERPVTLTDPEKAGIVAIVLRALRRSLDEQYQEIAGKPMRRSRETAKAKRKRAPREHAQT